LPQKVRVSTFNDTILTGDRTLQLTLEVTEAGDLDYGFIALPTLPVLVLEDERQGTLAVIVKDENRNGTLIIGQQRFGLKGKTELRLNLDPGRVSVRLEDQGLESASLTAEVRSGLLTNLTFPLLAAPKPEPKPVVAPKPEPAPEPVPEPELESVPKTAVKESSDSKWLWHTVTLGITGLAMLQSKSAADEYNSLYDRNEELAKAYASNPDSSYKSEYDSNQSKMGSLKSSVQTYDLITYIGLGVEAYLLFFSGSGDTSTAQHTKPDPLRVLASQNSLNIRYQWQF
jgi:hypothetical protein